MLATKDKIHFHIYFVYKCFQFGLVYIFVVKLIPYDPKLFHCEWQLY